jgi:poly-gamma-glutamate synthesis protein (capsule biosynthesis protein)
VATLLNQGGDPLAGIRSVLERNTFNVVNLESAVGTAGRPAQKEYTFQSPPVLLTRLHDAGVSVVNLANNHSLDYGPGALLETIANANAVGLLVVGAGATSAEAYAPAVVRLGAASVAVLTLSQVVPAGWGATAGRPGMASAYNSAAVRTALRTAHDLAQHVVVMIHTGVELSPCPSAEQRSLADTLLANGADVVVGTHPHVLQGIDARATTLIAYSLGNFVWYASGPETDKTGVLSVEFGSGAAAYEFTPALIDATGSPQPLSGPAASSASAHLQSLTPGAGRC